jgi:hypothetical protein
LLISLADPGAHASYALYTWSQLFGPSTQHTL